MSGLRKSLGCTGQCGKCGKHVKQIRDQALEDLGSSDNCMVIPLFSAA